MQAVGRRPCRFQPFVTLPAILIAEHSRLSQADSGPSGAGTAAGPAVIQGAQRLLISHRRLP